MAHVKINNEDELWVRNSNVSINKNDNSVYAVFTCQCPYWDASPAVKFLNGDPVSVTLTYENPIDTSAIRTVTFVNAVCKNYSESYDHHKTESKEINLWITFSIEAEAVALGEEDFPK